MDKVYEKRFISMTDLRALCIQENWFTRATNREYDKFLNMVYEPDGITRKDIDNETLQRMAEMVQQYSKLHEEVSIPSIMFSLARIRISFFSYWENYKNN